MPTCSVLGRRDRQRRKVKRVAPNYQESRPGLNVRLITTMKHLQKKPLANYSGEEPLAVSLKTVAELVDAHRSTVRRWLREAGIKPIALGRGRNGGIRYRWGDIQNWLESHRMSSG